MYCPSCRDEFRAGFTRCATCDVDLVETLGTVGDDGPRTVAVPSPVRFVDCCGFLALDEAREVRQRLRESGISSEIVLRDAEAGEGGLDQEEWWLRVDSTRAREAAGIVEQGHEIGPDPAHAEAAEEGEAFRCGECGHRVAEDEATCSGCGARFEE